MQICASNWMQGALLFVGTVTMTKCVSIAVQLADADVLIPGVRVQYHLSMIISTTKHPKIEYQRIMMQSQAWVVIINNKTLVRKDCNSLLSQILAYEYIFILNKT